MPRTGPGFLNLRQDHETVSIRARFSAHHLVWLAGPGGGRPFGPINRDLQDIKAELDLRPTHSQILRLALRYLTAVVVALLLR